MEKGISIFFKFLQMYVRKKGIFEGLKFLYMIRKRESQKPLNSYIW